MAQMLDNGDVAPEAPVHRAAFITDQHPSVYTAPTWIWQGRETKPESSFDHSVSGVVGLMGKQKELDLILILH